MSSRNIIAALLCVSLLVVGCNKGPKKPKDLPKLNPTVATVVYDDGTPVDGATIVFRLPQASGGRTWNVAGVTDASGKIELMTDGNWKGVPAGDYEVMVSKQISEIEEAKEVGGSPTIKKITNFVATKYNDPKKSGLTAKIVDGQNTVEFKVGEKIEEDVKVL